MVLAHKVGKRRPFALVALLYALTLGIYGIYWNYKAHHEVYKQFELDREGRDEGVVWLILGLVVLTPLLWVYQYGFVKNINYVSQRLRRRPRIGPGGFLGLSIPGMILLAVGFYMALFGMMMLGTEPGPDDPSTPHYDETVTVAQAEDENALGAILLPVGGLLFLTGIGLSLAAYGLLQSSINGVWSSFDQRMSSMHRPPGPTPGPTPGGAPGGAPGFAPSRPPGPTGPPGRGPPRGAQTPPPRPPPRAPPRGPPAPGTAAQPRGTDPKASRGASPSARPNAPSRAPPTQRGPPRR